MADPLPDAAGGRDGDGSEHNDGSPSSKVFRSLGLDDDAVDGTSDGRPGSAKDDHGVTSSVSCGRGKAGTARGGFFFFFFVPSQLNKEV